MEYHYHPKHHVTFLYTSYIFMSLFEFLDSNHMRCGFLSIRLYLFNFVLVEYLLLICEDLQRLLMLGIILHDSIISSAVMHLSDWIADSCCHIIQLLQSFIICTPLYCLGFGIDS